jgi:3-methyladenine DNA glycosylase AlkD
MRDDRSTAFAGAVREGLRASANPQRAAGTQAYMKSEMPFLGVGLPEVRRVTTEALARHPPRDWRAAVLELWRSAEYREERYAAIALLRLHAADADLELVEEVAVSGAWWDYVDSVARVAGELLRRDREATSAAMRAWARDEDRWKRRVSIICQLGHKRDTDLQLLYDCIEPNLADPDFFLRKAIGWALREYSKTDPDEVARYVRANAERLSPLSRREALKRVSAERGLPASG